MYIRHNKVVGNLGIRTSYQDSVLGNKQKYSVMLNALSAEEKIHSVPKHL